MSQLPEQIAPPRWGMVEAGLNRQFGGMRGACRCTVNYIPYPNLGKTWGILDFALGPNVDIVLDDRQHARRSPRP
jgi:hypothetical protein